MLTGQLQRLREEGSFPQAARRLARPKEAARQIANHRSRACVVFRVRLAFLRNSTAGSCQHRAVTTWAGTPLSRSIVSWAPNDHDNRSGHHQVGLSSSRHRCGGQCDPPSATQATLRAELLSEAAAVSGWDRSPRLGASLVARAANTWSHCSPDAAGLREALCEAAQE